MTKEKKIQEAMSGLFAYDTGATDSGIHDEQLKKEVKDYLDNLDENAYRLFVGKYASYYLSEEGLNQGYGIEDVVAFARWLEEL